MFKDIPQVIQNTFWKYLLLYCAIGIFGVILGAVTKDQVFILLSSAIMILGTVKAIRLLRRMKAKDYRVLEGIVLADVKLVYRNAHALTLLNEEGIAQRLLIAGKGTIPLNKAVRVYLLDSAEQTGLSLPDALAPAQTMLGYESGE